MKISDIFSKLWPTNPPTDPNDKTRKKTQITVAAIVLLVILSLFTTCARAAEPYTEIGLGATVVRGETSALDLAVRWPDLGPSDADLVVGVTFIGPTVENAITSRPQFAWRAELVDGFKNFEVGLGLAYLRVTDNFNCEGANFSLRLGYIWNDYLKSYVLHYSNGGTCLPNKGRDMIFPLAFYKRW